MSIQGDGKEDPDEVTFEVKTSFQKIDDTQSDSETETEEKVEGDGSVKQDEKLPSKEKGKVIEKTDEMEDVNIATGDQKCQVLA